MTFIYPECTTIHVAEPNIAYRREVVRYLELIHTTFSGQTLFDFMRRAKKTVTIMPGSADPLNALTTPAGFSEDAERIAKRADEIAMARHIDPDTAFEIATREDKAYNEKVRALYEKGQPEMKMVEFKFPDVLGGRIIRLMVPNITNIGTGGGTDIEIRYHPAGFRQAMVNTRRVPLALGPGEVLFHELVHALRMMLGIYRGDNVWEEIKMDGFEEFCSILAANIYRSERGFQHMRLHHETPGPDPVTHKQTIDAVQLPASIADAAAYYKFFKPDIDKWFNTQRDFCVALAHSKARFNPLRVAAGELGIPVP